jgi:hypothetical protein
MAHNIINVQDDNIDFENFYLKDKYLANENILKEIVKPFSENVELKNSKLLKLQNKSNTVSDEWIKIGNYNSKKPDNTPKTDLYSENKIIKLSLKKFGGSQLMSGGENESKATLIAASNVLSQEEKNELGIILGKMNFTKLSGGKSIKDLVNADDDFAKLYNDITSSNKAAIEALYKLFEENPNYKTAVIKESMTGKVKFGDYDLAIANYIFSFDVNSGKSILQTPEEFIESHRFKFYISFKSASSDAIKSPSLRIDVK